MFLTGKELKLLKTSLEENAGIEPELLRRCGPLFDMGAFDEAVRSAFALLEERLREATGTEGLTGSKLANQAFSPKNGKLALQLGQNESEREGLRELYSGSFKLFRNPTAHGAVDYSKADGRAILYLVNMLIQILSNVEKMPKTDHFPANVQALLTSVEGTLGPGSSARLSKFLGKTIGIGLRPLTSAKQWIPFKRYAKLQLGKWTAPKNHKMAVFYIGGSDHSRPLISFSTSYYYPAVVDFQVDQLVDELCDIGFRLEGKHQEPVLHVESVKDPEVFDRLFDIVQNVNTELTASQSAVSIEDPTDSDI